MARLIERGWSIRTSEADVRNAFPEIQTILSSLCRFSPEPDASSSGAREVSQVSIHMKDINQWQQGYYKCAASNEIGSGESDALRLEVLCE